MAVLGHFLSPSAIMRGAVPLARVAICLALGCPGAVAAWPLQLSPEPVGSVGEVPEANDVAVSGGVAALAQNRGGIDVLDVSQTNNPRLMGRWRGSRQVVGVDLAGSLVFAACGDEGFFVVDLTDPGNPRTLGSCGTLGWASDVVVVGGLAYVAEGDGGLHVIDVSDPGSPRWRGRVGTSGWAARLVVVGDLAYVATSGGLDIVDIADADAPVVRGTLGGLWLVDVAVDGQYAFAVVNYDEMGVRLAVIDVTDPASPALISSLTMEDPWSPRRILVRDGCAYVTEYYNGLHVFDVSDPAHLALAGPAIASGVGSSWSGLAVSGAELYLAAERGVTILSLASPTAPTRVGDYVSQAGIWSWGSAVRLPLICIAAYDRGLVVLDASEQRSPREIGSCALPGPAVGVAMDGDLAVLACGEAGTVIVDIADPARPVLLAMCAAPGASAVDAVAVHGHLAFVGCDAVDGGGGLHILDISDPGNPAAVSFLPTGGEVRAVIVSGALAYVGDSSTGLHVVDVSDPAVPRRVGGYGGTAGGGLSVSSLEIAGDLLFLGEMGEGFEVLDISDPAHPRRLGGSTTFEDCYATTAVGDRLLVADDQAGVTVFDVSDPSTPRAIGRYPDFRGARSKIIVDGNLGFVPYTDDGVQVLDFSRIAPAQIVGWLPVDGRPNRVAFDGDRGWVGEGDALLSLDLSITASPRLIGTLEGSESVGSMEVRGNHIFMANGEGGFRVMDISDPAAPQTVAVLPLPGWANGLRLDGDHAFVTVSEAGVAVVDISDPTVPRLVAQADTGGFAYNLTLAAGHLALVADMGGGLAVIDVSDPTSPRVMGSCSVGGARDVAVSGTYAFVACEYEGLRVVDFSDPHNPELVASLQVANSPRSIVIIGSVAYLSDEIYGLVAVDISDPLRPVGIGGNALHSAWKISSDGGRIYLSGYYDDLAVLEPYDAWFQWRVDRLGAAPGGPFGAEARDGDDPDSDGLPNLMEFALSMDPLRGDGGTMTGGEMVTGAGGEPVLRFTARRNGVSDSVGYVVEVSEDLVHWRFDPALLTTVRDDAGALVVDVAMGPGHPAARFARLRVVRE